MGCAFPQKLTVQGTPPDPAFTIPAGSTIAALLKNAPIASLETRILLSHVVKLSRVQLITQPERAFTADEAQRLTVLLQRRICGEPIAYLIGEREFYGLPFHVTSDVLIPRPETELLVDLALEHLPENGRMLDMGTGSGAIAIAVAHTRPDATVTALDVCDAALSIAHRNAVQNNVQIAFLRSDWYGALTNQHFDLIVANPPYIVRDDPHLFQGDLRFEPVDALTDHADGLAALRSIIVGATHHLAINSWLLMEHGYDQSKAVRQLCSEAGLQDIQSWTDLAGIERVSGGRKIA